MDRPLPWLRYVEARALINPEIRFDRLTVRNDAREKLGTIDGFIVDADSGRPYYVVVDAGGWFKSRQFLLPVGHARLDSDRDALVADLTKERIGRFPGFDKSTFHKLTDEDIRRFNDETCEAASLTVVAYSSDDPFAKTWDRPDFRYPDWWQSELSASDRMGNAAFTSGAEYTPSAEYPPSKVAPPIATERPRENIVARTGDDVSPHFEGRAQPGDVLGVETGGEATHIGDTAEDENERRLAAEKATRKRTK